MHLTNVYKIDTFISIFTQELTSIKLKGIITYHRVSTTEELNQILKLQQDNLPKKLSRTEKENEGFVTVHHKFDILKQMNDACPHVVAKHNNLVIGYALCMTKEFKAKIPVLLPWMKK